MKSVIDSIMEDVKEENQIKVSDYVNNELREYAVYDNTRSIPSMVDGLKTSQRKVIYTVFKTLKPMVDIKTTSLGASASNLTHYKHGENSIIDTVIGMAQDFAGSNNYPLLLKEGQFGTAINNTNSSPRYIFVKRHDKLDEMFDVNDREIVNYLTFDGDSIEPEYYLPKLPMIIINGTLGIGNGYSTKITQRDVKKVAKYIHDKITKGKANKNLLLPSYNGFTGKVEQVTENSFLLKGVVEKVNSTTTIIKDLPPTSSYQYERYKTRVLLPLLENPKSGLTDIENESTEGSWNIILKHSREFGNCTEDEMLDKLKMVEKLSENITVWGFDNKLKVYNNVHDLVDEWLENKKGWIAKRKEHILNKMAVKCEWQESLLKLIEFWLENTDITKLKKDELVKKLKTVVDNDTHITKFLEQNIMSLTKERVDKLREDIKNILKEKKELEKKTVEDIFVEDVLSFI